jgi:hypothetical protein
MRHLILGLSLFVGSLLAVQTTAAFMQQQAMRGHEVSQSFSPGSDMPRFAQLSVPRA